MTEPVTGKFDREAQRGKMLSPREEQCCAMVSTGMTNREIGYALGICEGTIKLHIAKAMAKRGLRNRVEMALDYITNIGLYRNAARAD